MLSKVILRFGVSVTRFRHPADPLSDRHRPVRGHPHSAGGDRVAEAGDAAGCPAAAGHCGAGGALARQGTGPVPVSARASCRRAAPARSFRGLRAGSLEAGQGPIPHRPCRPARARLVATPGTAPRRRPERRLGRASSGGGRRQSALPLAGRTAPAPGAALACRVADCCR